jgi:aldehyde:ferredoxin oxidoreductase
MRALVKQFLNNQISRRGFIKGMAALGISFSSAKTLVRTALPDKIYGWTGTLLRVELPSGRCARVRTLDYGEDFVGGRALASRIYYDEVSPAIGALEPDNLLFVMSGPLGGTNVPAGSRWVITAKSPYLYPDQYSFGNGGGFMGAGIKHAGYDGIVIRGKAKTLSYLLIENEKVELKDGKGLQGHTPQETMSKLKRAHGENARIVSIGPAGENLVHFAIAFTDQGGALSNGMGAVMGSKNLKAIVVKGTNPVPVAYPERIAELDKAVHSLRKGLVHGFARSPIMLGGIEALNDTPCYGCPAGCTRARFRHTSGEVGIRKNCGSAYYYLSFNQMYSKGAATDVPFLATQLANRYGLCTRATGCVIDWLYKCFKGGILSEDETGLPLSKIGSLEFIEALADTVTNRKGFGELLAQGARRASIEKGKASEELALTRVTPSGYSSDTYSPRIFLITALFYATETRDPSILNHEINRVLTNWALWHISGGAMSPVSTEDFRRIATRAWGGEKAVDFSTYDGKAKAAFIIQNRQHAKEAMVACDQYYPLLNSDQTEDHMGDPTLVPQFFHAVTGHDMKEPDYLRLGERSVNLQRAIQGREGKKGREADTISESNFSEPVQKSVGTTFGMFNPDLKMPGAGDAIITRKGTTFDRAEFERMKDEYYQLRGWDVKTGLQTRKKLKELGLGSLCDEMEKKGLLKG